MTGSESTANNRTSRFDDDCNAPRHCIEHVLHDVSAVARSQGRARNRYCEAVERADRADLHGVAREVRVEGLLGEVQDLRAIAAIDEVDQGVAGDLVGESRAARALDAALAVEQHEIRERNGLREVALLFDEPRLARTERERLVLQGAFAAAVAHRAVERVIDEQELEHAVLDLA